MQLVCLDALSEKLKLKKVLRRGILFPEFMSCCWLYENGSWPFVPLFKKISVAHPKIKGISLPVLRNFEEGNRKIFFKSNSKFLRRLRPPELISAEVNHGVALHLLIITDPKCLKDFEWVYRNTRLCKFSRSLHSWGQDDEPNFCSMSSFYCFWSAFMCLA